MKTSKDFDGDMYEFAKWIYSNGFLVTTEPMGPVVEHTYRVEKDTYTLVIDAGTGKFITVYE